MDQIITTIRGNVVTMENLTNIFWKNFSGKPDRFNNTSRKFTIGLDEDTANALSSIGLNVKKSKQSEDPEDDGRRSPYNVQAKVNYRGVGKDPVVFMLRNGEKRLLTENTISILDWQYIEYCDVTFNLYRYNGNVSLYVMSAYFILPDDAIAGKYDDWVLVVDDTPFKEGEDTEEDVIEKD